MSTVEVALTETRLWARSEATHWDGPPSIVPTSDRAGFVVGEPLRAQYPAVSVMRLASADRIAFGPNPPTTTDALTTIFGAALTNLRLPGPCQRLTVLTPSEWGTRRRQAVETAGRRVAAEVMVEPLALRAAALGATTGQQQRIAVLELAPLTTTVTLVGRSGQQSWVEACEYEPTIGAADLGEGRQPDEIAAVVARLLGGQSPSYLVALGISDTHTLDGLRSAIARQCGFPVDVRAITGGELIHGVRATASTPPPLSAAPTTEWVGSVRERAESLRPRRSRRPFALIGAALAVLVAAGVTVAVLRHESSPTRSGSAGSASPGAALTGSASGGPSAGPRGPESGTPTAAPTTPAPGGSTIAPTGPASGAPISPPPDDATTIGHVRIHIPPGWRIIGDSGNRTDLTPNNAARQRITIIQKSVAPGTTLDDVAAALETQIRQRPAGTFGPLRPAPALDGHRTLTYDEFPSDGTTVRWRVILADTTQVSIGCQSTTEAAAALAPTCDEFVRVLTLVP